MIWQVQDAKQRLSEVIRAAHEEGPQVVTRHGREVAVVIDVADYRRLKGQTVGFREYLLSGPGFDDLELDRSAELPPGRDWLAGA